MRYCLPQVKIKMRFLKQISNKEVDLILGTHALFQSDVEFNNLGLVIDEQPVWYSVN